MHAKIGFQNVRVCFCYVMKIDRLIACDGPRKPMNSTVFIFHECVLLLKISVIINQAIINIVICCIENRS